VLVVLGGEVDLAARLRLTAEFALEGDAV